jgi:hypothetical protein
MRGVTDHDQPIAVPDRQVGHRMDRASREWVARRLDQPRSRTRIVGEQREELPPPRLGW